MAKIQCKMCGGMVELQDGMTVGECPYCGSTTTFPKLSSPLDEQLYGRAEHYRLAGEFDKAVAAYESIIRANPEDAEAYWGLVLSSFGIEYVEDPASHERIPTCHRVQYESILADSDYKSALEHAVGAERDVYEREAARIAEIQKDILSISSQEEPFDVFICYKETTDGGSRTKDSAIAQDIYYRLANSGLKVFFSRITLENKLGYEYEPYIFAALHSAKVMLVIGTCKEHFNAVWVKNEWSRFLALMKNDRSLLLIPCYRGMDPYDIPEELSMLQALDMSKIGFMQDLMHGIKKVLEADNDEKGPDTIPSSSASVEPLLKRILLFLKTEEYDNAIQYCERVLDMEPENSQAYLYRLMAENHIQSEDELYLLPDSLEKYKTFNLLMEFADADMRKRMGVLRQKQRDHKTYESLKWRMKRASTFKEWNELAKLSLSIKGFNDADELGRKCQESAQRIFEDAQKKYQTHYEMANRYLGDECTTPEEWDDLAKEFESIGNTLPEAAESARQCRENVVTARFNNACKLMQAAQDSIGFEVAAAAFNELIKESPDAKAMLLQCRENILRLEYRKALSLMDEGQYEQAIKALQKLTGYSDSASVILQCEKLIVERRHKRKLIKLGVVAASILFVCLAIAVPIIVARHKQDAMRRQKLEALEKSAMALYKGKASNWETIEALSKEMKVLDENVALSWQGKANTMKISLHRNHVNSLLNGNDKEKWTKIEGLLTDMQSLENENAFIQRKTGDGKHEKENSVVESLKKVIDEKHKSEIEDALETILNTKPLPDVKAFLQNLESLALISEDAAQKWKVLMKEKLLKYEQEILKVPSGAHIPPYCQKVQTLVTAMKPFDAKKAQDWMDFAFDTLPYFTIKLSDKVTLEMVKVQAGTFLMGDHTYSNPNETLHRVRLTHDFWIGRFEVTQEQYETIMMSNPSPYKKGENYPVTSMEYNDAREFCNRLTEIGLEEGILPKGYIYDLPTEAQWEFAARGGLASKGYIYSGSNEMNDVAWSFKNTKNTPCQVGTRMPNELGLHDMSGNVAEWCRDRCKDYGAVVSTDTYKNDVVEPLCQIGSRYIVRGGHSSYLDLLRVSSRFSHAFKNSDTGFRVALVAFDSSVNGFRRRVPPPKLMGEGKQ